MTRIAAIAVVLFWAVAGPALGARARFQAIDVWVDGGEQPLAAYQVELGYDRASASLVGIEGGDKPFSEPPHYDPRGLTRGRVMLAAFTLEKNLVRGRVRVARIHFEERGDARLEVRLVVAGTAGGENLSATATLEPTGEQR